MEPGQTAGTPHYYALLEVSPDADGVTIQAAFRRQVRRFHPDVNPHPDAAALMRDLNAAYAVLGNPERRASYDTSHGVSWGGAVSSVMHGTGTAPSRTVGVRASGGAYAPRWGGVVGGPRASAHVGGATGMAAGVATATTHGTSFMDPGASVPTHQENSGVSGAHADRVGRNGGGATVTVTVTVSGDDETVQDGWASRIARAVEMLQREREQDSVTRTAAARATAEARVNARTNVLRGLGSILAVLALVFASAVGVAMWWGSPGIMATLAALSGGTAGAPMRASAPVVVSVGGAMPASLPSMRNPDAVAPVAPREPLAPVPPTASGAVAPSIPAPLPPLGSTASVPALERTSAVVATNAVAASSGVTQPAAAADGSASKVTTSTNPSSTPKSAPVTSSGTPAARALNTYDQSWTTYTGTLRRLATGEPAPRGTSASMQATMARVRFLEAQTALIRQTATIATPEASSRTREATALSADAEALVRQAQSLITEASGAPVPAARALLDEASRRHARALAIWATVVPQA